VFANLGWERQTGRDDLFMAIKRSFYNSSPSTGRPTGGWWRVLPTGGGIAKLCTTIAATLAVGSVSFAQDEFLISGTYRSGRPCRGDDARSRAVLITITPEQITHPGGVCTIDDKRQQGNTIVLRTTCKDRRGTVLSGDVSFTVRDDKTIDMTAQGGSYTAVLNRCSEPSTRPQPGNQEEPAAPQ
jgi:hypothetical protein